MATPKAEEAVEPGVYSRTQTDFNATLAVVSCGVVLFAVLSALAVSPVFGVSLRVFAFSFFSLLVWTVCGLLDLFYYTDARADAGRDACMRPNHSFTYCGWVAVLSTFGFSMFYVGVANTAGAYPLGIALPGVQTPCGAGSCTRDPGGPLVGWAYNPNGYFSNAFTPVNATSFVYCPSPSCNWAPSNGLPIVGYPGQSPPGEASCPTGVAPACDPLDLGCDDWATANPSDYPDPGVGLRGPVGDRTPTGFCSTSARDSRYCPGVTGAVHGTVTKPVCAYCLKWWRDHGLLVESTSTDCPDSIYVGTYQDMCWICPGSIPGEGYARDTLASVAAAFLISAGLVGILVIVRLGSGCRSRSALNAEGARWRKSTSKCARENCLERVSEKTD